MPSIGIKIKVLKELLDKYADTHCPECNYEQYCPCKSCNNRVPEGKKPYINAPNDSISCANCGHTLHSDQWLTISVDTYNTYMALKEAIQLLEEQKAKNV